MRFVSVFSQHLQLFPRNGVALSVISLPETTPPGGGGELVRRAGPRPAGRAYPRRPRDHFLLPLPLALAILPPLARDAGD